jgi:hypothetical protein
VAARQEPDTIRAYGEHVAAFRAFTGKGLRSTYLSDLQRYADALVAVSGGFGILIEAPNDPEGAHLPALAEAGVALERLLVVRVHDRAGAPLARYARVRLRRLHDAQHRETKLAL